MRPLDDLPVPLYELGHAHDLGEVTDQSGDEQVCIPLHHDDVGRAALRQHVAIEARGAAGADKVVQQAIAADALVQDGDL
jgi:hypothetical protein